MKQLNKYIEGIPSKYLSENDNMPGIKVDKGAIPWQDSEEKFTEGLDVSMKD